MHPFYFPGVNPAFKVLKDTNMAATPINISGVVEDDTIVKEAIQSTGGYRIDRVENRLFPDYARFQASMPRPEGPRHSLRSGSRSDSLRGSVAPAVLKCTIVPGICP